MTGLSNTFQESAAFAVIRGEATFPTNGYGGEFNQAANPNYTPAPSSDLGGPEFG